MPKVFMVAHWDWALYSTRLSLAKALRDHGYSVTFVCPFGNYIHKLQEADFRCIHWTVIRESCNPIYEIVSILHLFKICSYESPDLLHNRSIKPNLYGSLVCRLINKVKCINTFEGLGYLFSDHLKASLIRKLIIPLMRFIFSHEDIWTVFLNDSDRDRLVKLKVISPERAVVIPSIGVDISYFYPALYRNDDIPKILMACRLLWDKGVREFVEAAKLLRQRGINAEFWLAGAPDSGNPMCVPEKVVKRWHESGLIRWLGHCDDMPNLLRRVDIAVLPTSYNEGVPRFLLEAASSGLPIVATDIEGCRMVVRHGENGFLVPVRDSNALADAIEKLVRNPQLRVRMGKASREIAVREFDERKILEQWLILYKQVMMKERG